LWTTDFIFNFIKQSECQPPVVSSTHRTARNRKKIILLKSFFSICFPN
jgi:hypothetical protein